MTFTYQVIYYKDKTKKRRYKMKIVNLCKEGSCCPVVKLADGYVEIGEEGNLCSLTMAEWEILKAKILSKEL